MTAKSVVLPFAVALASAALTWAITAICRRHGWVVAPRPDRWHRKAVAQFGGLAILLSFVVTGAIIHPGSRLSRLLAFTFIIGMVGLWDDVRSWRPIAKLLAQVIIASVTVYLGVVYPFRSAAWINVCFTVFWIVGITNAFNLLDNMDGLAAGVGAIAAVILAFLANDPALRLANLMFAGALAGFLVFNFKPAKIFMGDTGSLVIGYYLGCASVLATQHLSTVSSILFIPVLVLFIPVFDTALVSVTRRLHGRAISAGARDHTSHRLVLMGISETRAVLLLYALAVLSGAVAVLCKRMWPEQGLGLLGVFLLIATLFWVHLARLRLPEEYLSRTNVFTLLLPALLQSAVSKIGTVLLDMCVMALSLYLAFLLRFGHLAGTQIPYLALCFIALMVKLPPLALYGTYREDSRLGRHYFYVIVKSAIVSSLAFVTAAVFLNRFDYSLRAVFAIDALLTIAMLTGVRWSGEMFDHVLRSISRPGSDLSRLVSRPAPEKERAPISAVPTYFGELAGVQERIPPEHLRARSASMGGIL